MSELMIAATILLVAILGLLALLINCIILGESNNNLVIAVNDAQHVLEQLKGQDYTQINNFTTTYNPSQFNNLINETISFPYVNIGAKVAEVTVEVDWVEKYNRNRDFRLSTRIAR